MFHVANTERVRAEQLSVEAVSLRSRVEELTEENARLVGHHNHKQRIQHHYKVKEEYNSLHLRFTTLQAHATRCEEELRKIKRIPHNAELTFDEEEEQRRVEAQRMQEENARMAAQLAALSEAVRSAATEAYVSLLSCMKVSLCV